MSFSRDRTGRLIVDDRYLLLGRAGEGGMAQVWRARDRKLERMVALKVMRPEYSGEHELFERLVDEARAAARIDNDHVVRVYDWSSSADATVCYIVMEYVEGRNLRDVMEGKGAFSPRMVARMGYDICDALVAAHEKQVVHSDVKPSNVMLCHSGRTKLTDFGVARIRSGRFAENRVLAGTVQYMSPEQMDGHPADQSSDIFSLGVTLYELACGRPPYAQLDMPDAATLRRWLANRPVPSSVNPRLDGLFDQIVHTAMDPDPAHRFPSASVMRDALAQHLSLVSDDGRYIPGPGNPRTWNLVFVMPNGRLGHAYSIEGPMTIGSGNEAQMCIHSPVMSPIHVSIRPCGCVLEVKNHGPHNSMRVNGRFFDEAFCTEGDVISVGPTNLRIGCRN